MGIGGNNLDKLRGLMEQFSDEEKSDLGQVLEENDCTAGEITTRSKCTNMSPVKINSAHDDKWNYIEEESFVNPYNFVSIDSDVKRKSFFDIGNDSGGTYTGWIQCTIEPKTEVFIPKVQGDDAKANSLFLDSEANPVIPGSSLRGIIRSAYEAVTNSCLSTAGSSGNPYKRTPVPKKMFLVLKREMGIWKAYSAEKCMIKYKPCYADENMDESVFQSGKYEECEEVYVEKSQNTYMTGKGRFNTGLYMIRNISREMKGNQFRKGYVHYTPSFPRKHHQSVFIPGVEASLDMGEIEKIRLNFEMTVKHHMEIHKNEQGSEELRIYKAIYDAYETGTALVYYYRLNDYIYASPSCISAEIFNNTIKNILQSQNGHQPCEHKKNLCEACSLFGMTGELENSSVASRIRFTDASISKETKEKGRNTYIEELKEGNYVAFELGSPKVSSTEFYLKKPENNDTLMWNYDYSIIDYPSRNNNERFNLVKVYKPKLKGRKFYWHFKPKLKHCDKTNTNTVIKNYIKASRNKEILFNFKLYFNNITEAELNKLLWVLTIGERGNCGHKIGCGKPYGMGSIKIEVCNVTQRIVDLNNTEDIYVLKDYEIPESIRKDSAIDSNAIYVKEFLAMSSLENGFENVIYPLGQIVKEGRNPQPMDNTPAQWFIANKSGRSGNEKFSPTIANVLPTPLETSNGVRLYKYYKFERQKNMGNKNTGNKNIGNKNNFKRYDNGRK